MGSVLDVVTIGSATLDIFLRSDQFKIDRHPQGVYLCERYEGKIEAQELVMASGGGATNAAVSYARKGLVVAPLVEMGRDPAAEMILIELAREQLDLSLVIQEPDEVTAVSVILLAGKGGNSIVTYRGASRMLTVSDIPFEKLGMLLKPGGWIHLTSVGGGLELVEKVLGWTKEKGRKIYWNPGQAEIAAYKGPTPTSRRGRTLSDYPDVLQVNRSEASELFGVNFQDEDIWKSEHCPTPPDTILLVTDGKNGGRVCHRGACSWYKGVRTKMIDSTGGGDAFGSSLVAGLIHTGDVRQAVELARKQAASVVSFIGAKQGLLRQ